MLETILFAVFALTAVICALGVVFHRNPVHCALLLVGVLLALSGLFILLNAQFIAALQVIVYAGAIMVLFLFVLMLLNFRQDTDVLTPGAAKGFGFLFAMLVFVELLWTALSPRGGEGGAPLPAAAVPADFGSPAAIGRILYTTWLYPFEITSILLLVAVIGAVILAKRKFVG
ncbi:MAG TPA: NADH-quinone oxidoreductase subunit J [Candidatus Eisenbacteria bacterium]|nr:NADH-quinone oxidoreductase subunit J [Candidatus Eisenbacteria bacterium]